MPALLPVLAWFAVLAPGAASPALLSNSPQLQLQKQPSNVKVKQPISLAPTITSVTPQTCARAGEGAKLGDEVTLGGSNFGVPKPAGYTLAVQPAGSLTKIPVTESSWTATSITFNVPAGLAAGTFTVGILKDGAFVASVQLSICAKTPGNKNPALRPAGEKILPQSTPKAKSPFFRRSVVAIPPSTPGGPPEITSVSPPDCVGVGGTATAGGVNLGTSKLTAGFSLGFQAGNEPPTVEINESSWSPTGVSFTVPPEAAAGGWFALGIIFESVFYAQQYVSICGASSGGGYSGGGYSGGGYSGGGYSGGGYSGGGYSGGGYDSGDYGNQDSLGGGAAAGPKGARRLGPGGVDVQIAPAPAPEETAREQPQQPGKPVVGGKLLAMKALAGRGLRKVNKECDLYDPHCPCCRKDDSVCLEKESDNEDGTSLWVVSWKQGAKTADGQGLYEAQNAREDVEAVTGFQCEPVVGGDEGSAGRAKLNCR